MITPNILNVKKLYKNLRHPIYEVLHTKHSQYPIDNFKQLYVVEHEFAGRLVTLDVIKRDESINNLPSLLKNLFDDDFYYGHCKYFPKTFRLLKRNYIKSSNENLEEIIKKSLD